MRLLILSAVLFLGLYQHVDAECCEEYCYSTDADKTQAAHFTSKTAYEVVKGADYGTQYNVPNCRPTKFWLLSRHGTRLPEAKTIKKMPDLEQLRDEILKNYQVRKTKPLRGALCPEDIQLLTKWNFDRNITADHEYYLTLQGWNDLKFLAKNYQRIFPEILSYPHSPQRFLFRYTKTQRTEASFKGFAEGLFGDRAYETISTPPIPQNFTLLEPHDNCPKWVEQNDKKSDPGTEIDKFKNSELMKTVIANVSTRLGFQYPLEYKQVDLMWDMCRYEQAWYVDSPSAWCTAFLQSEIDVLEYLDDMKYQYKSGYASEINPNVPCEVIQDMLKRIDSNDGPEVVAYFSHSALIQMTLVALGAYKDVNRLKSDNFYQMTNRQWRVSKLAPFSANLAVIKYDCQNDPADKSPKVIFFLNQHPLALEWCKVGLCKWSDVKEKYSRFLNANCQETFCGTGAGSFIRGSIGLLLITFLYNFFM